MPADRTVPVAFVERLADVCRERSRLAREASGAQNANALEILERHLRIIARRAEHAPMTGAPWPEKRSGTDVAIEPDHERRKVVVVDPALRALHAAGGTSDVSDRLLNSFGLRDGFYGDPSEMLMELAIDAIKRRARDTERAQAAARQAESRAREAEADIGATLAAYETRAEMAEGAGRVGAGLLRETTAELARAREVIEFLRSLTGVSEDTEARGDIRVPVDGEEFISYRVTKSGRTYYVYANVDGRKSHQRAGTTLEEALELRAKLHPEFAAGAGSETTRQGAAEPGPSSDPALSPVAA